MFSIQYILSLFQDTKASRLLILIMGASIIQIMDLILTIFLTHYFGDFLILACISSLSLIGLFFSYISINRRITCINTQCSEGSFPESVFLQLTGAFIGAVLLFIPGFFSSFLGFFILFPPVSSAVGQYVSNKTDTDWHTVYEYMKI